jgi:hypothetical protein
MPLAGPEVRFVPFERSRAYDRTYTVRSTRMTDNRDGARQILQRIADALGTDVATLSDRRAGDSRLHETLDLLAAFSRVTDRQDRRACLDYVRSLAGREHRN